MLCKPMTAQAGKTTPQPTKTTKLKPALDQNTAKLKIVRDVFLRGNPCYTYFIAKFKHHFNCL